jgi:hypothetical protein
MGKIKIIIIMALMLIVAGCKDSTLSTDNPIDAGTKLYYIRFNPDSGFDRQSPDYYSVMAYDLKSNNSTLVLDKAAICSNVSNGEFLYIKSDNKIYCYNTTTKASAEIPNMTCDGMLPMFLLTKTGKVLYFEKYTVTNNNYYRIYLGTKSNIKAKMLSDNMKIESIPSLYLSDSYLIYGVRNNDNSSDSLFSVNLNTEKVYFLIDKIQVMGDNYLSFSGSSKDGLIVALSINDESANYISQIITINALTKEVKYLTNSMVDKGGPVFSPDGSKIIYPEWDSENSTLLKLMNKDGSSVSDLVYVNIPNLHFFSLKWIDGSHVAYSLVPESNTKAPETYILNLDTKQTILIDTNTIMLTF